MAWWDNVISDVGNAIGGAWNSVSSWLSPAQGAQGMVTPPPSSYGGGGSQQVIQPQPTYTYLPIAPVGSSSYAAMPTPTAINYQGMPVPSQTIAPSYQSSFGSYQPQSYQPQQAQYSPYMSSGGGYASGGSSGGGGGGADPNAQANWQAQFNSAEEQRKWQNAFAQSQFDYTQGRDAQQFGFDEMRFNTSTGQWERQFTSNEDQRGQDNAFRQMQFDNQNNQWNQQFGFQGRQFDEGVRQFGDTLNRLKGLDTWNQAFQTGQFDWQKQQAELDRAQRDQQMTMSTFGRRFAPNYGSGF